MALTIEAPSRVPPTVAQQIFVIGSGVAGGLAGIKLSRDLVHVKDVPMGPLVIATLASIIFTLGAAVYLSRNLGST